MCRVTSCDKPTAWLPACKQGMATLVRYSPTLVAFCGYRRKSGRKLLDNLRSRIVRRHNLSRWDHLKVIPHSSERSMIRRTMPLGQPSLLREIIFVLIYCTNSSVG